MRNSKRNFGWKSESLDNGSQIVKISNSFMDSKSDLFNVDFFSSALTLIVVVWLRPAYFGCIPVKVVEKQDQRWNSLHNSHSLPSQLTNRLRNTLLERKQILTNLRAEYLSRVLKFSIDSFYTIHDPIQSTRNTQFSNPFIPPPCQSYTLSLLFSLRKYQLMK